MLLETGLSAAALAIAAFPFGLIIGSFLNVVILRFPEQLKNSWRRESEDFLGIANQSAEPEEDLITVGPGIPLPFLRRANQALAQYSRGQLCVFRRQVQGLLYPYFDSISAGGVV